jgi:hypothetical protein
VRRILGRKMSSRTGFYPASTTNAGHGIKRVFDHWLCGWSSGKLAHSRDARSSSARVSRWPSLQARFAVFWGGAMVSWGGFLN